MTDELATARAEIAALRARITRLTTVSDEDVERVAKALYRRHFTVATWENARDKLQKTYRDEARAALEAHTRSADHVGDVNNMIKPEFIADSAKNGGGV